VLDAVIAADPVCGTSTGAGGESGSLTVVTATLRFGYDGDDGLGDRLLESVLRGDKTATSSLAVEYLSGGPLPRVGQHLTLVDSQGIARGTVQTTGVTITPLNLVGDDVARAEGEGFDSAAEWRRPHVSFWDHVAPLVRADAGDPAWQLREAEPVVVHWFRLVPSDEI
jgi:uncharacterized protein YhfF